MNSNWPAVDSLVKQMQDLQTRALAGDAEATNLLVSYKVISTAGLIPCCATKDTRSID